MTIYSKELWKQNGNKNKMILQLLTLNNDRRGGAKQRKDVFKNSSWKWSRSLCISLPKGDSPALQMKSQLVLK